MRDGIFSSSLLAVDGAVEEGHGFAAGAGAIGGEGRGGGALGDALADGPEDGVIIRRVLGLVHIGMMPSVLQSTEKEVSMRMITDQLKMMPLVS